MVSDEAVAAGGADDSPAAASRRLTRRGLLASGAATLLGSGCLQQSRSLVDRSGRRRVSLSIKTMPADDDAIATTIARRLSKRLTRVGVDASVTLLGRKELYREVLLNQSFDLYVARFPDFTDPDVLRPLLHSAYTGEVGWQNPFRYTDIELDDKLESQRRQSGQDRIATLRDVERIIARDQPFTVIAFPEEIRTARRDRIASTSAHTPHSALRYLALESVEADATLPANLTGSSSETTAPVTTSKPEAPVTTSKPEAPVTASETASSDTTSSTATPVTEVPESESTAATPSTLRVTLDDVRPTENLNPLAVEFRNGSSITELLYDPLGRHLEGSVRPWLAADWEWRERSDIDAPRATISLRDGLTWHDGTPLTASDVTFTYRFLRDTSLGRFENPVPAPIYRGDTSLVDSLWLEDDGELTVQFRPVSREVAARAFTVPVLPEHVWAVRSERATIAGVDTGGDVTEALIHNNVPPVGSGPARFERVGAKEALVLSRFEDHFLHDDSSSDDFGPYAGGMAFERLVFEVVPSTQAAVELVDGGAADYTGSPLSPAEVSQIGRDGALGLRVERPNAFYHVGYNATAPPTSNVRFRRAVAHLLDKGHVADQIFDGYADPAASPLARDRALSPALRWDGTDPATPFPGIGGRLDADEARELFTEAGYRYVDGEGLFTH